MRVGGIGERAPQVMGRAIPGSQVQLGHNDAELGLVEVLVRARRLPAALFA
jgi:hypothetical protein